MKCMSCLFFRTDIYVHVPDLNKILTDNVLITDLNSFLKAVFFHLISSEDKSHDLDL